jgi:hypothetical protein
MKNNLFLILVAAFAVGSIDSANAGKFVDVSNLGTGLVDTAGATGTNAVNATVITTDLRFTRDKTYILSKNTIIKPGVTVTVDPGTLIRCEYPTSSSGANGLNPADPGAIVVNRGARLMAQGTAEAPIIMTSMDDPFVPGGISTIPAVENVGVSTANTGAYGMQRILRGGVSVNGTTISIVSGATTNNYTGTNNATGGEYIVPDTSAVSNVRSYDLSYTNTAGNVFKWEALFGGIVTSGRANVAVRQATALGFNARTTAAVDGTISASGTSGQNGTEAIEGMAGFTGYSFYGGDDDLDSTGVVRFVSNRYGGFVIASNKELNGYTWCATGQRTVAEFVESYNNADDDHEFFGGCVGVKYGIGAFGGDDGFDTDMGYCGVNQFLLQIQNSCDVPNNSTFKTAGSFVVGNSGRYLENAGDSLCENDGPEQSDSRASLLTPLTVFTHANYTGIGRGYGPAGWARASTSKSDSPLPAPCLRDKAGGHFYNSIWMDAPHAGPMIVSTEGINIDPTNSINDSITRMVTTRTSGGFDGSGLADDLVTSSAAPTEPDLTFRNCAWYRCGLGKAYASATNNLPGNLDSAASYKTGKYTYSEWTNRINTTNWEIATKFNIMPEGDITGNDRTQKDDGGLPSTNHPYNYYGQTGGWSTNVTGHCVDFVIAPTNSFSTNGATIDTTTGNAFNLNPRYNVAIDNRVDGSMNLLLPTNSAARSTVVSLPTRGNLSTGANFMGAFRDNNWARSWTMLERAGVFSGLVGETQIAPVVVVSISGGNPVVNFDTVNNVKYSVEASVDNKFYRPLATVTGTGLPYSYPVSAGLSASATQSAKYSASTNNVGARLTTESTYAAIPAAVSATPLFFRVMAY